MSQPPYYYYYGVLFPRVISKKLKSKLEWLLVRNVVDHKSVVQKNRVETLQRHWQRLEQKWWRSFISRETAELVTEITQELQSGQAEGTKFLNGNRLKDKIRCQVGVLILLIMLIRKYLACRKPKLQGQVTTNLGHVKI